MGLSSVAGEGTAGFFRKSCASPPPSPPESEIQAPPPPPPSPSSPPPGPEGQGLPPPPPGPEVQAPPPPPGAEVRGSLARPPPPSPEKRDKKEEEARLQREENLKQEKRKMEEAVRVQRECEKEEEARVQREREREKEEAVRAQQEKEGGHCEEEEIQLPLKKRGRKRKADEQLVPEDVPVSDDGRARGRPSRTRKMPKEAEEERKKQLAATLHRAGKPGWEYVDKSPTKGAAVKGKHGSTRYEIVTFNLGKELKTDLIELQSPGT
ncbi:hypothetical protein K438DRAFT_1964863 [Mycena galopus ATCC 62051]|nr:hypothetical protein K438DRAFT_1964863 [Mycena galopus ATCC 62051]